MCNWIDFERFSCGSLAFAIASFQKNFIHLISKYIFVWCVVWNAYYLSVGFHFSNSLWFSPLAHLSGITSCITLYDHRTTFKHHITLHTISYRLADRLFYHASQLKRLHKIDLHVIKNSAHNSVF